MTAGKYAALISRLKALGSVAVAFSGGADSALLLYAAHEALGDRAAAITALSPVFPRSEADSAEEFCRRFGIRQLAAEFDIMKVPGFGSNPTDRCYHCKKALLELLINTARKEGPEHLAEGSNTDDEGDHRPGARAVAELGVISPLKDAGLSKSEIRELSKQLGLPTWDKPSYACLATRIPYGDIITLPKLAAIGRGEELLHSLRFLQCRVRLHGQLARIEIMPEQFEEIMRPEVRGKITRLFAEYGFSYVSLDLTGYRTGSMNETIKTTEV
ncbi:uncharacterized protein SAMN02910317_00363 [Ruminococcaceae bacterium FB2012]|nr:uncharacterized protein SAMN02910317_00363 [Ruminococcaceae bacterium FB2012]